MLLRKKLPYSHRSVITSKWWPRQTPISIEKKILHLILKHPELSSQKISHTLGVDSQGKKILGNHGVQNVLRRLNLSTYQKRLNWRRSQSQKKQPLWLNRQVLSPYARLEIIRRSVDHKE